MNEQYKIEIEKENQLIHQGNIFDQCTIGADKNNYYQSSGLKNNELLIREIGGVYNLIANSPNWSLNGKKLQEKKYYILGPKNKLKFAKYNIEIKKIKDSATGGLELASEKIDVKDLIGINKTKRHDGNVVDIFNTKKEVIENQKEIHFGYFEKIGVFAKFTSNIFNVSLFYLSGWVLTPYLFSSEYANELQKVRSKIFNLIQNIKPNTIQNNEIFLMQEIFKESPELIKFATIIDQVLIQIIFGFLFFLIIKSIFSIIFGRPITFFFLGIGIDGSKISKRIKAPLYEILNPLLAPLSFYNFYGLLPIKSLPEIILRITYIKTSRLLKLTGPIFLTIFSLLFVISPLIGLKVTLDKEIILGTLSKAKAKNEQIKLQKIELIDAQFDLPLGEEMNIDSNPDSKGNRFKISGGKLKKNILISEIKNSIFSWDTNLATGNPLSFITFPIHALKNIQFPIPQGNAEAFQLERLQMFMAIADTSVDAILNNLINLGPFQSGLFFSTLNFHHTLDEVLPTSDANITSYWIKNNGTALVFQTSSNLLITYPLDPSKPMINFTSSSPSDLAIYTNLFLTNQSPLLLPLSQVSVTDEIFKIIDKLDLENLSNKINNLSNGDFMEKIKNVQNTQKELTNQVNKATKATGEAIDEIESE